MDHNAALTDVGVPPKQVVKHLQGSHLGKLGLSQEENFQQKFLSFFFHIFLASKLETSNARNRTSKRTQEQPHLTISNPEKWNLVLLKN